MRELYRNRSGFTLTEALLSMLLLAVIFLAVSSLYVASQRFYFSATDKVMIGYELEYAIQHIYDHVMLGEGDKGNPPIIISGSPEGFTEFTLVYIDKFDQTQKTGRYKISSGKLEFDSSNDGVFEESLGSKVTFLTSGDLRSKFSMDGEMLKIRLTAEFPTPRSGTKEQLTLYAACYPRLASFR